VAGTDDTDELARLQAEADHLRRRLDLYRARAYGMRPTSPVRMRELEREAAAAADRLAAARARAAPAPGERP
jgi:hypothetical protein